MFYKKSKKLRVYKKIINKINSVLSNFSDKDRISPILVSNNLSQFPEETILSTIFYLVKKKEIRINYEITCPECSSDTIILPSLKEIPEEVICDVCNHKFKPDFSDIWITISLTKKHVKRKDKIKKEANNLSIKEISNNPDFLSLNDSDFFQIDCKKFELLIKAAINSKTKDEKKRSLEELGYYLFSCILNCKVVERNKRTPTSELDILIENNNVFHPFLKELGRYIPIECKNWKKPVGASEIRDFGTDIKNRKFKTGILISKAGITGDRKFRTDAYGELKEFFRDGIKIYVLSLRELEKIKKGENLLTLLREKDRELHLN